MKQRKTKYRAWDKENKCMITFNNMERCDVSFYEMARGKYGFILMQYIGKKDINKKEIYEGDIISYSSKRIGSKHKTKEIAFIDYCPDSLEYKLYFNSKKTIYNGVINLFKYNEIGGKIIGNIYKNKELLK